MPDLRELDMCIGESVSLSSRGKRYTAKIVYWQPDSDIVYLTPPIEGSSKKLFNRRYDYPVRPTSVQNDERRWIPAPREVGDIEVMETIATRGDYARIDDIPVRNIFLYRLLNESVLTNFTHQIYHRVTRRK